jgi:IS30 family transposase
VFLLVFSFSKAIKLTDSVKNYISEKLKEYWSPEQIMGRFTPFSCRIKGG